MRDIEERAAEQLDRLAREHGAGGGAEAWDDVARQVGELYDKGGLLPGTATGWPVMNEFYTVAQQQWTLITGAPGMGKSEWLDALAVNLVETGQWVFAMYSPENFPVATHVVKIMEKRARKPFNRGPRERMSRDEMVFAGKWVKEHFTWVHPAANTLMGVVQTAARVGVRTGRKLGIVVDPWNMLDHYDPGTRPLGMTETEYISNVLSRLTRFLRCDDGLGVHVFVVAHPAKLYRGQDGKYPLPTGYDVAGSAHFFNKADAIIVVHRDKAIGVQDVEVHVQKMRFKHCGTFGAARLKYDRVTGRYFDWPHPTISGDLYADPESGQSPPSPVPSQENTA